MKSELQSSRSVLLVRPAAFGFHAEAAESNAFANPAASTDVTVQALREFDGLAHKLDAAGVEVLILEDQPEPARPDAIFPNNWVSLHADGTLVLYPMATCARRIERNAEGLSDLLVKSGFELRRTVDLTSHEHRGHYLEGTGSLILDRPRHRVYASVSPRTDPAVVAEFERELGYSSLIFDARDPRGDPIYHTNVLLSLGTHFAVLCADAVVEGSRTRLMQVLEASGRAVITVDYHQLLHFACNILEVRGRDDQPVIALSSAARKSFRRDQLRHMEKFAALVDVPIPTIEAVGGGSVRCMIADIHLPRR